MIEIMAKSHNRFLQNKNVLLIESKLYLLKNSLGETTYILVIDFYNWIKLVQNRVKNAGYMSKSPKSKSPMLKSPRSKSPKWFLCQDART